MTEPLGSMRRLGGKVVAISGAAFGIGEASAARLAAEATLALCDLEDEQLAASAQRLGLRADRLWTQGVDGAEGEAYAAFIDATVARFGQLDALVNNAGIGSFGYLDEIAAGWRRTMVVDLDDAVFFGNRAALRHLRRTGGCIVNTASISGLCGYPSLAAYNTAKAGVIGLTRNMAVDHAHEGVRVNCICPGVATTMLKAHTHDAAIMEQYASVTPMIRVGQAGEMAAAICILSSLDASYITGNALVMNGGSTAPTGQTNFDRIDRERRRDKTLLQWGVS